uniref:Uncharacterized protein n=1 Tax=Triticum urartu TaxID=4572 RepID=A0A8R7QGD0_TRIUA
THATTSPPPPPPPPPPPRSLPLPRFAIQITAAVTSRNRYRKRASQTNANPKSPIRAALSPRDGGGLDGVGGDAGRCCSGGGGCPGDGAGLPLGAQELRVSS